MNKAEIQEVINKIMDYYDVYTHIELAEKMGISTQAITNWKSRDSIVAIKKKCKELGIYEAIFANKEANISSINDAKEIINLLDIFSPEELDKLNKTATDSNIPLKNLLRLGVFKMGLL